jgi:hypothetical protein
LTNENIRPFDGLCLFMFTVVCLKEATMMLSFQLIIVNFLALAVTGKVLSEEGRQRVAEVQVEGDVFMNMAPEIDVGSCTRALKDLSIDPDGSTSLFSHVSFDLHRNGDPFHCGATRPLLGAFQQALALVDFCTNELDKYQVESFLTAFFATQLDESDECGSEDDDDAVSGLLGYCDMGPERTVVQLD